MAQNECKCTLAQRMTGDGCDVCNTSQSIEYMPTPVEMSVELMDCGFAQGQAEAIASEIYQPLINIIGILSEKIDRLERVVKSK